MDRRRYRPVNELSDPHLHDLHRLYQGEWWTKGRTVEGIRQMLVGSDYVFGVCRTADQRLVGFARVLTDAVFKAMVFDVIVAPECRREGLGRAILEQILSHPKLSRLKHIELYCLPELVPFYQQWGFSADVAGVTLMRRTDRSAPTDDN